nr:hypothetical protein [Opitutales bacterium]
KFNGISAVKFAVNRHLPNQESMSGRQKADALQNIYEMISCSDLSIIHESMLDEVAQLCNLDRRAIGQDFDTFLKRKRFNHPLPIQQASVSKDKNITKLDSAESQLLAICLDNSSLAKKISDILDCEILSSSNSQEGKLLLKVLNEAREGLWEGINSLNNSELFSEEEKNCAYSVFAENDATENLKELINSCLKTVYLRFYKEKINQLDEKINKISLDEKATIRDYHRDRMCLRQRMISFPQIDSVN